MIIDRLLKYAEKFGAGHYFLVESSKTFEIIFLCLYNIVATVFLAFPFIPFAFFGPWQTDLNILWRSAVFTALSSALIVGCVHGARKVKDITENQLNYVFDIIFGKIVRYGIIIIPFYAIWHFSTYVGYEDTSQLIGKIVYIAIPWLAYTIFALAVRKTIKEESFAYIDWKLGFQEENFSDFLSRREKYRTSEAEMEMMKENLSIFGGAHRDFFFSMLYAPFIAATVFPVIYGEHMEDLGQLREGSSTVNMASTAAVFGIILFIYIIIKSTRRIMKNSKDPKEQFKPIGTIDGLSCYGRYKLRFYPQRMKNGRKYLDSNTCSEAVMYLLEDRLTYYGIHGEVVMPYSHLADVSISDERLGRDLKTSSHTNILRITPKKSANVYFYCNFDEKGWGEYPELPETEPEDLEKIADTVGYLMEKLGLKSGRLPKMHTAVVETTDAFLKPWIGKNYDHGINGHKVMVLGASHYATPEEWNENFTNHVIKDLYLNPEDPFDNWKRTYTKFERAMAGYEVEPEDREKIWNNFMFWNFIQEPMSGPDNSVPSDEAIYKGQRAFLEILKAYRPTKVIVWGETLYGWLPDCGAQGERVKTSQPWKDGKFYDSETWEYEIEEDYYCTVMPLADHPARAFSWEFYHLLINEFLKK